MRLVASRLGDDVDHAPARAPVLRLVPARLDLDLLDEILQQRSPYRAEAGVGDVYSVDDVVALG